MHYRLTKGLDIPIDGRPFAEPKRVRVKQVALCGADYGYRRVSVEVSTGDAVREGEPLFTDRRNPEIRFVAPASGTVRLIERGPRRRLEVVVIEVSDEPGIEFQAAGAEGASGLGRDEIRNRLLESGLWTAIRARPYDRIPDPEIEPRGIFVTAIDTNPLAADPFVAIDENPEFFRVGLAGLSRLTAGTVFVCTADGQQPALPDSAEIKHLAFSGPHPAGLAGTHMAAVGIPIGERPDIWHLSGQDVLAIGQLLACGRLSHERVIAVAGPGTSAPRLVRAPVGADLYSFCETNEGASSRLISGSFLVGRSSPAFLGRYHHQCTVMPQVQQRLGSFNQAASLIIRGGAGSGPAADTGLNGWPGAMLPLEDFDRVWPYSTPAGPMLRALLTADDEAARRIGCLGLAEEDLALLNYVAADKQDYAVALRNALERIERSLA